MILTALLALTLTVFFAAVLWVTAASLLEALGGWLKPADRAAAWFHRHGV
jgi:hypothetical protein